MNTDKLPNGWTRVKLGDVVEQIKDRVDVSAESPRVYVPGGSIGRTNFKIAEWLPVDDGLMGPAFHMVCRSGDVLYKSRVPHGVAVADRSGICANTTYVLRTRDESVLLQDLLPHLLSTDMFLNHESLNDKGSTNLYLNFSDIAKYEFALPPIEEQQRLAVLLGQSDVVVRRIQGAIAKVDQLLGSLISASYRFWADAGQMSKVPDFGELTMGRQKAAKYELGVNPVPYLRVGDIGYLEVRESEFSRMDFSEAEIEKYNLRPGDVLVTEGDLVSSMNVGRAAVYTSGPAVCAYQNHLIRIRPRPGVNSYFVMAMLEGARQRGLLAGAAGATTIASLGLRKLSNISIPSAPQREQSMLGDQIRELISFRSRLRTHLEDAHVAVRAIRNSMGL